MNPKDSLIRSETNVRGVWIVNGGKLFVEGDKSLDGRGEGVHEASSICLQDTSYS